MILVLVPLLLQASCAWMGIETDLRKIQEQRSKFETPTAVSTPSDVAPAVRLIDRVRERGIEAQAIDASRTDVDPFLSAPRAGYQAGRAVLYLFVYPDRQAAEAAAARVPPDAHRGGWDWADDARYSLCDRVIVLQFRADSEVSAALADLCGPPFAVGTRRF